MAVTSAQSFASADSAFGPCSAISARSASELMTQAFGKMRAQMRLVLGLAGGVDHQKQMVAEIRDHQVVENAAVLVGELRVALPSRRNRHDVLRHQPLQRQRCIRDLAGFGPQRELAHMRDVEQPGCRFAYADVPSARPPGIAPASRSPRREPSCRRAPHGARAMECVSEEDSSRASIQGPSRVPGTSPRKTRKKAPSVAVPESIIPSADALGQSRPASLSRC